ncbi:hypothetical protein [Candidatus Nitrosocosmicus franklandus]|uniref:Uncharacterized protein n=1 Tax=Candidatus Nitrosocosmicus franklandianus TaxID=1798806 RepID=A0A484ICA3_9ARCH|nr:hypothetical protein [Candidatus Nitrosocosmicus franklandus]VFJ13675.1 conserved protein of unknown function [Candidatus Nitrosocosmicus franklandus]
MEVQIYDYKKYIFKPDIRIGNYFFQWDANELGIDVHEINHLKNFIRKIIPVLEQYMILLQNENKKEEVGRKNTYTNDRKQLCIKEKYDKRISFLMFIDSQGSTFFYREETCYLITGDKSSIFNTKTVSDVYSENSMNDKGLDDNSIINYGYSDGDSGNHNNRTLIKTEVKWLLGELLFDRNPKKNR